MSSVSLAQIKNELEAIKGDLRTDHTFNINRLKP